MEIQKINKIDFVLPWVDSNDVAWQAEKAKYASDNAGRNEENNTRYRDTNTLRYVLRSIEKYCSWYHKIYLITAGHYPDWLDVNHPKIKLVTHEELYINKTHLPIFNSSSIEMNLINIKKLSEKFIYLNDDTIIWKSLKKERFFKNNKPVDFFHHAWIPRNKIFDILKGRDSWIHSLNNNIQLINKKIPKMNNMQYYHHSYPLGQKISNFLQKNIHKKLFWIKHWHHPQPYLRSTIKEVYTEYKKEMLTSSYNRFRENNDLTQYIYRYWHLMTGNFEPYFYNDGFVAKISSLAYLENAIRKIEQDKSINFVCFNDQADNISHNEFERISDKLGNYLESKFPDKASFEN